MLRAEQTAERNRLAALSAAGGPQPDDETLQQMIACIERIERLTKRMNRYIERARREILHSGNQNGVRN